MSQLSDATNDTIATQYDTDRSSHDDSEENGLWSYGTVADSVEAHDSAAFRSTNELSLGPDMGSDISFQMPIQGAVVCYQTDEILHGFSL